MEIQKDIMDFALDEGSIMANPPLDVLTVTAAITALIAAVSGLFGCLWGLPDFSARFAAGGSADDR
jgi:hypothetical protein